MLVQAKVRVAQTLLSVLVMLGRAAEINRWVTSYRVARRRAGTGSGLVDQISSESSVRK